MDREYVSIKIDLEFETKLDLFMDVTHYKRLSDLANSYVIFELDFAHIL